MAAVRNPRSRFGLVWLLRALDGGNRREYGPAGAQSAVLPMGRAEFAARFGSLDTSRALCGYTGRPIRTPC